MSHCHVVGLANPHTVGKERPQPTCFEGKLKHYQLKVTVASETFWAVNVHCALLETHCLKKNVDILKQGYNARNCFVLPI